MTRAVAEWIGPRDETPAPPRVKDRIVLAQDGICACGCGVKLGMVGERVEFDHTLALINGGENREANLRALRQPCHTPKTREDVKTKAKIARVRKKHLGIQNGKKKIPYRRFDGTPVYPK